jgi:anti-sigma factor RsiW
MKTDCEFDHELLIEHAAGRLQASGVERVQRHLAECESCRADLVVLRAVQGARVEVPEGLERRIRNAVRDRANAPADVWTASPGRGRSRIPRWSWRTWAVPLAAAAALAGVLLVGGNGPTSTPELATTEDYAPYGAWPGSDGVLAGDAVLSELSVDELERLLEEMES